MIWKQINAKKTGHGELPLNKLVTSSFHPEYNVRKIDKQRVEELKSQFNKKGDITCNSTLSVMIHGDSYIVLDGNHRLHAISQVPVFEKEKS